MDKRRVLEERRKAWLAQRTHDEVREECEDEFASSSGDAGNKESMRGPSADAFLSRLTEKLADRIRDEIRKEVLQSNTLSTDQSVAREAIEARMESYLRSELSNYVCKICYEVMQAPDRTPILLFPCGHTFCKNCMDHCNKDKVSCPYCRAKVQSSAINQSLKDLIDQFVNQRQKVSTLIKFMDDSVMFS